MMRHGTAGLLGLALWAGTLQGQPPSYTDLGYVSSTSLDCQIPDLRVPVSIAPQQVLWFRIALGATAQNATGRWLDIDTTPGVDGNGDPIDGRQGVDTQMALYNAAGMRVSEVDDDDGVLLYSQLSFGQTMPARGPFFIMFYPDNLPGDGRDGGLTDSVYYLAVVHNDFFGDNVFGDTGFNVVSASDDSADFAVEFRTNLAAVPEPAAWGMAGLALASAGAMGYRRWRRRSVTKPHPPSVPPVHGGEGVCPGAGPMGVTGPAGRAGPFAGGRDRLLSARQRRQRRRPGGSKGRG
jgi:hypothetical protein